MKKEEMSKSQNLFVFTHVQGRSSPNCCLECSVDGPVWIFICRK